MMNLECTLLNQDSYNYQEYHTVTERAFFHWLKSFEKRYNNSKLSILFCSCYSELTVSGCSSWFNLNRVSILFNQ